MIYTGPTINNNSKIRCVFFGTPLFAVPILEALLEDKNVEVVAVVTQPDRPAGRGAKLTPSAVKQLAQSRNIAILQPEKIKNELATFLEQLESFAPIDLGIVVAFGQILPKQVLDLPTHGCINVHASLLPRWRGAAPIQRAIMHGDKYSGVCLMQMELTLDTGAVYAQKKININADDTYGSLHDRLAQAGRELISSELKGIVQGKIEALPQSNEGITYADKISNQESEIDWNDNAAHIARLVRALNPSPGAFTYLGSKRLKIFGAQAKTQFLGAAGSKSYQPGQLCLVDKTQLEVTCAEGILALSEVQLEGKRRMGIEEFLKGIELNVGQKLGR